MRFSDLLSRADDETLQAMIGSSTLRLLRLLDPGLVAPSRLRNLLVDLHTYAGLLADAEHRSLLLELLRPAEAHDLVDTLKIPSSADPYTLLRTLKVSRGSVREQALFDFFELAPPTKEVRDESPASQLSSVQLALFKHQRGVARRVKVALSQEPRRVLLHMPTGAGKTRTAMHIIADHLRANEPALVIWLAYSEELCEQATVEFERTWQSLGDRDVHVHRFWGTHQFDFNKAHDGIVVASLGKLYSAAKNELSFIGTLAGRCSLAVIDEAHQAIAETYRLMLDTLVTQGQKAALLGLTATPGRTWDDVEADLELAQFFGERKVTLQVEGYANPINYLIDHGYLARAVFTPLLHTSGLNLSARDLQLVRTMLDIPDTILQKLAEDEQRNLAIVVKVEELVRRHTRIILFAASVVHAQLLAVVLQARGIDAATITGFTPSSKRVHLINEYKSDTDRPKVLCNYGVLTTGFDAPRTSAALIARPTKSLVLYSQMVGRAIRGPRVGGNHAAEIITVIDRDLPGFGDVAQAFSNWEDVWRET